MKAPAGFTFAGTHAGLKGLKKDLALIYADTPCVAAGCFTVNAAKAAPILDLESRLPANDVRAILINSGNANALTGPQGIANVRAVREELGRSLNVAPESILTASTGLIGHPLPVNTVTAAFPKLIKALGAQPETAAEAILTTDTRIKLANRALRIAKKTVQISAIAKGSGMIAPELATVLVFVTTNAAITGEALTTALRRAMKPSFNALVVDGDMSTNDCALILANGRAGNPTLVEGGEGFDAFTEALTDVCQELAKEVALDGEGATKLLQVTVRGAPSSEIASDLAKAVTGSTLVKAAVFGADPNWGRVLAAIGARVGSQRWPIDVHQASVLVQTLTVYDRGPTNLDLTSLKARMREPVVALDVDLRAGEAQAQSFGCDLSYDYVKINADYSSLLMPTPEGGMTKDNRLTNYSPGFKTALLVEALSYISKFAGQRCVVACGDAPLLKDSLKKSLCDDLNLLRSIGLVPLLVHAGAPGIAATLSRMGAGTKLANAAHGETADLKVVEMVLSGSVNSDLVTLLNQEGGHAVGVSGKDGAFLRARRREGVLGTGPGSAEITRVNKDFLEMLLAQRYIPVVSPIAIGEDGQSYNLAADAVAAEIAVAIRATKLIYLGDTPGLLRKNELVPELTSAELDANTEALGAIRNSVMVAIRGGVDRVHLIDGRVPHSIIAELFTERGVGTLVTQ